MKKTDECAEDEIATCQLYNLKEFSWAIGSICFDK